MQPNYAMWPFWRDKYTSPAAAMRDYYPEVLAQEPTLRQELIRIEAYETFIDKLVGAHEDRQLASAADLVPLWSTRRDRHGYAEALSRHYAALLRESEQLRVALQNVVDAKAAIDQWMTAKADEADHTDE